MIENKLNQRDFLSSYAFIRSLPCKSSGGVAVTVKITLSRRKFWLKRKTIFPQ